MRAIQHWLGDRLFQLIFRLAELHTSEPHSIEWNADCDRQRDEATSEWLRREASGRSQPPARTQQ